MTLKELRKNKMLTQSEAASYLGISLRTYQTYESDLTKQIGFKYNYIVDKLRGYGYIDEDTGLLTIDKIKEICLSIFSKYSISYAYLFGSYAKGKEKENSDVDLLVSADLDEIEYFQIMEELREALHKKVDFIMTNQIENNFAFTNEILKDGIKIYG